MLSGKVPRFRSRIARLQVLKFQGSRVLDCQGSWGSRFPGFKVASIKVPDLLGSWFDASTTKWPVPCKTSFQCAKVPRLTASTKVPDLQGIEGCRVPRFQGYRAPGIQGCRFQWFQSSKISEFRDCRFQSSPAFQGCNVTGQSSTLAPRSQGCRFPRFQAQFKIEGFQDFRVSAFQGSRIYLSRFFRAPWLGFADTWNSHAHQAEKNARHCGAPAKGSFKGSGKGFSITVLARDRRL